MIYDTDVSVKRWPTKNCAKLFRPSHFHQHQLLLNFITYESTSKFRIGMTTHHFNLRIGVENDREINLYQCSLIYKQQQQLSLISLDVNTRQIVVLQGALAEDMACSVHLLAVNVIISSAGTPI